MTSDKFVSHLGLGFIIAAICGIAFEIHSGIVFGLTIFALALALSGFLNLPKAEEEKNSKKDFYRTAFARLQQVIIVLSIPFAVGLPLIIGELFVNPNEVFTKLSNYIAILSVGIALMTRK